jgi:hypothetical protein
MSSGLLKIYLNLWRYKDGNPDGADPAGYRNNQFLHGDSWERDHPVHFFLLAKMLFAE